MEYADEGRVLDRREAIHWREAEAMKILKAERVERGGKGRRHGNYDLFPLVAS